MPSLDKLMLGSTLDSVSQPVTRKQRFGRGQHASCLLSLPGFHLGVLRAPSAWEQHSTTAPVNTPSSNLLYFPSSSFACGVGFSVTTGKQLRGCSLSFWWASVSRGLQVLSGYLHLFLLCPEHNWHGSQYMVGKLRLCGGL